MLHLRRCILARLLSSPFASPISPLHRLLSAAAPAPAAPRFAVDEYLVDTCGLTRAQALKASMKLSHLKSPTNPDAVLAFLADLGLSGADVAALVAKDPLFLCASIKRTLAPVLVGLTGIGLSHSEIAGLVSLVPISIRCKSVVSNLPYYLSLFGSYESLFRVLKSNSSLLSADHENKGKPNVAILRECGLGACDIAKLCSSVPWLLTSKLERLQSIVASADALGVPRESVMFRHALHAVGFSSEENVVAKVDKLKKMFRWSDAEVAIAVCRSPMVLGRSTETLQRHSEFLFNEVGLEPAYIAHRPSMLSLSLEGRLKPRYYAMKFLKENGLLDSKRDYFYILTFTDKVFVEKFISCHKEAAPQLAEDYAAACRGEGSTNFRLM